MEKKKQSKMRLGVLLGIVVLLSSALLVGACAKAPAPATPTPGKPAATPAPAPVKPIKLVWASASAKIPEFSDKQTHNIWLLEEIKKRSGGRIVFEEYWGGALGTTGAELLELVRAGAVDMSTLCPTCGTEDWFRWESGINNIFLVFKTHEEAVRITRILFDEFPEFQEQWAKQNSRALTTQGTSPYGFITKIPTKTLADLKGKKFLSFGSYVPKMLNAIGIIPVSIPGGDVYDAIRSGLLDGRWGYFDSIVPNKFYEVAPYFLMLDMGVLRATPVFINLKTYNSLPADLRKMIDDVSRESDDFYLQAHWTEGKRAFDFLKGKMTYSRMSKADNDAWITAVGGVYGMLDDWVDVYMTKLGLGVRAKQVADRIKELSAASWKNPASSHQTQSIPEWTLKSPLTGQVLKPWTIGDELPELFK